MSASGKPTGWGIISAGKICHDFVTALQILPATEHVVKAVAARKLETAQEFANSHSIPTAYGSYEELTKDPEVEVVYIGAINPQHLSLAKLAISRGKHVVCEKPLCMNVKETQELVQYAREKKVFLMEGIWSRFFPAYNILRDELDAGTIGTVTQVIVSFCSLSASKERCALKELGGGTTLDTGVYCIQLASLAFGGEKPVKILAGGHLNEDGIDESTSATLFYKDGRTATLITNGKAKYESNAVIIGTQGVIQVPFRWWCPTGLITPTKTHNFELPQTEKHFNYSNSVGLCYEAQEVRKCLQKGLTENPLITLNETLLISEIMESIRKQTGVIYAQDI